MRLVKALRRLGHDALMVPMYLPLVLDDSGSSEGITALFRRDQRLSAAEIRFLRHTPQWLDKLFDSPALLRQAGKRAG